MGEELGYSWWARIFDAGALGAPHRRERVFIIGHDDARDDVEFEELMADEDALPPECRRRMAEAPARWNYWTVELAKGAAYGCPTITTTPTVMTVLEPEWPEGRIYRNGEGQWRKCTKQGTVGSASWSQEMIIRAISQRNPRLLPTPECCEDFMGFPRGWTCLDGEVTLPEELAVGWDGEADAEAYSRLVRNVRRIPDWRNRVETLGNAVVVPGAMILGACIQRWEFRPVVTHHDWAAVSNFNHPAERLPAHGAPGAENSRHLSPVQYEFETLGVEKTKMVYAELDTALRGLASTFVRTMEEIVPHLERMQRLLSQRGADRRMVLKRAGLPTWTEWAEGYARSLHCTLRTIQRHILLVRGVKDQKALGSGSADGKKTGSSLKRVALDPRQQAELVRAQLAANVLAATLRNGDDWRSALSEFESVAVAPDKLEKYLRATENAPNWRPTLTKLLNALEACGSTLPLVVRDAMTAAQDLLVSNGHGERLCSRSVSPGGWPVLQLRGQLGGTLD